MDKHSNASRQRRSAKSGGTFKRIILGFGLVIMRNWLWLFDCQHEYQTGFSQ